MTDTYTYEQFQDLNEVLTLAKEELTNFDMPSGYSNRYKLRQIIKNLIGISLQLSDSSPYIRKLYCNFDVLNERRCTERDLSFVIESLTKIKRDFFPQYFDKIFISHSEKDKDIVDSFISLLHDIGVQKPTSGNEGKIFCSSSDAYLIPLRENNVEYIKSQLDSTDNVLAVIMYSKNYMNSPYCLNEAGAIWIKNIPFQPIILPDFSFNEVKGFLNPNITGFEISNKSRLNDFKEQLLGNFNLPVINYNVWEQDRDKFLKEIKEYSQVTMTEN
ncbi:TIR domain-containing protein [bacterium]|nr:TIR domain-containing protein [bacterium]